MSRLRLAKDIMTTNPVTVAPDDDVFGAIQLLLDKRITGAPVLAKGRRYLGVLSERSCMRVLYLTAREAGKPVPSAQEFMAKKLFTLRPEADAVDAISTLLKRRFSGAPVVDDDDNFLGIFSEHYIMRLLINSAYDQVPSTRVDAFMNNDTGRLIEEGTDVLEIAKVFLDTHYRRLPVLRNGKLVGQVSHRDVLTAQHELTRFVKGRRQVLLDHRRGEILGEVWQSSGESPSTQISNFIDTSAETVEEGTDILTIAQKFLSSVRIRLPVLRDGELVGQVSRRDLLTNVLDLLSEQPKQKQPGLFLSALMSPEENPLLR